MGLGGCAVGWGGQRMIIRLSVKCECECECECEV
jgi:hypothetical protein